MSISTAVVRSSVDVTVCVSRGIFNESSTTSAVGTRKVIIELHEETEEYDGGTMNVGGSNDENCYDTLKRCSVTDGFDRERG